MSTFLSDINEQRNELLRPPTTLFPTQEEKLFAKLPWITRLRTNEKIKYVVKN
jgi:hypothetical protein